MHAGRFPRAAFAKLARDDTAICFWFAQTVGNVWEEAKKMMNKMTGQTWGPVRVSAAGMPIVNVTAGEDMSFGRRLLAQVHAGCFQMLFGGGFPASAH